MSIQLFGYWCSKSKMFITWTAAKNTTTTYFNKHMQWRIKMNLFSLKIVKLVNQNFMCWWRLTTPHLHTRHAGEMYFIICFLPLLDRWKNWVLNAHSSHRWIQYCIYDIPNVIIRKIVKLNVMIWSEKSELASAEQAK